MAKHVKIFVRRVDKEDVWSEDYHIADDVDASAYGQRLIQSFNDTLFPGETARVFVRAEEVAYVKPEDAHIGHAWEKSNLVTVSDRRGYYDTVRCKNCGITGKRYGLAWIIQRDPQFKAAKYDYCDPRKK